MLNKENAIEVVDVKKTFKVYHDKGHTLKEKSLHISRNKYEKRDVLKGISFNIKKGEAVGLIGHNGCGKSTTLKLLTRIIYPDCGKIELNGRVSSLLELGAGFHPDMSGRENIYINASIFGLGKKEIDNRMDEIIDFSELGEFIDNPVRTYSSGMYMRLAFSVAINVNADILLIDEILAVGDINFQAKCYNKLMDIKEKGTTIVLVSHSMDQIERVCGRCIWIQEGRIAMDGKAKEVNDAYLNYMSSVRKEKANKDLEERKEVVKDITIENKEEKKEEENRRGTGEVRIKEVLCYNEEGKESYYLEDNKNIQFKIKYHINKPIDDAVFGLCIHRNDGVRCYGINTKGDGYPFIDLTQNGEVILVFTNIQLLSGKYTADVTIETKMGETVDYYDKAVRFEIDSKRKASGVTWLEHQWILEK